MRTWSRYSCVDRIRYSKINDPKLLRDRLKYVHKSLILNQFSCFCDIDHALQHAFKGILLHYLSNVILCRSVLRKKLSITEIKKLVSS